MNQLRRTVDHYIFIERGISLNTALRLRTNAYRLEYFSDRAFSPPNYVFRHDRKRLLPMVSTNSFRQGCRGALPGKRVLAAAGACSLMFGDRKSTRLNSSHLGISYAVFCLK